MAAILSGGNRMFLKESRLTLAVAISMFFVCLSTSWASAQDGVDPNSPSPVIVSESTSTRAVALNEKSFGGAGLPVRLSSRPFRYNSSVVIFVTNLALMDGEGANALRAYVEDAAGKKFRFPVTGIQALEKPSASGTLYALTLQLEDEKGFWAPPENSGDVFLSVTWRGMTSNKVILAIGRAGVGVKPDPGSAPTPLAGSSDRAVGGAPPAQSYIGYRYGGDEVRLMEQATFGPTAALDSRIRKIGVRMWLAEQLDAQYPSPNNPYPSQPLKPGTAPSDCDNNTTVPDVPTTCFRDTYTMYQPLVWFMREAFYGNAQLRHRVAWALAQIWVTSGNDIQQGRHMVEYHKILSKNAFGNYRTLMKEMSLNATMGSYLDMARSTKNNPNENYARELMQLFTIGLFMLNQDGTYQLDGTGNPIPTYDQNTVNNLTKVLTGWSFCETTATCPNRVVGSQNYIDPMLLSTGNHDLTAKLLLSYPGVTNQNVAACTGCTGTAITNYANTSMDQALDNIFNHPNVGPFIGKILIQHLVTSDPTPAYVGRIAAVFNNNGLGERGDMKSVVRAILLDPEARGDLKTDPSFGKLREPVLFATNVLRQFNVRAASGSGESDGYLSGRPEFSGMGQTPFLSPTVFNFYPPSYVIPGTSMLGPEFAIMTTGTAIQRANFLNRFAFSAIPVAVSTDAPSGTSLDLSDLQALSSADSTGNLLVDELNRRLLHGTMTPAMRSTLLPAVTSISTSDPLGRARQAVYLVATSSQYQVQR
jgi:uncharacterized protein (DUF1800 family)